MGQQEQLIIPLQRDRHIQIAALHYLNLLAELFDVSDQTACVMEKNQEEHDQRRAERRRGEPGEETVGIVGIDHHLCGPVREGDLIVGKPRIVWGLRIVAQRFLRRGGGIAQNIEAVDLQQDQVMLLYPPGDRLRVRRRDIVLVHIGQEVLYPPLAVFLLKIRGVEVLLQQHPAPEADRTENQRRRREGRKQKQREPCRQAVGLMLHLFSPQNGIPVPRLFLYTSGFAGPPRSSSESSGYGP